MFVSTLFYFFFLLVLLAIVADMAVGFLYF